MARLFIEEVGPALAKLEMIQDSMSRLHEKYTQEAVASAGAWAKSTEQIVQSYRRTHEEMQQADHELVQSVAAAINTSLEEVLVKLYSVPVELLQGESREALRKQLVPIAEEGAPVSYTPLTLPTKRIV